MGIAKRVEEYYRELFKEEEIDHEGLEKTLDSMKRVLTEEGRELCEGEIGKEKLKEQ